MKDGSGCLVVSIGDEQRRFPFTEAEAEHWFTSDPKDLSGLRREFGIGLQLELGVPLTDWTSGNGKGGRKNKADFRKISYMDSSGLGILVNDKPYCTRCGL